MRFTNSARRAAGLAGIATVVVALVAPSAQAASTPATAVTKTTLTPYDIYDSTSRYGTMNKRTISGTATGVTSVDIVCLNVTTGNIDRTLTRSVTVAAGKWSSEIWTKDISGYRCRVAAIEASVSPAGDTDAARLNWGKAFKSLAPVYQVWERYYYFEHLGGPANNAIYNSGYFYSPFASSEVILYGADQGGMTRFKPRDAVGNTDNGVFGTYYGSGNLGSVEYYVRRGSADTASLLVDGAQAFTNYSLDSYGDDYAAASSVKNTFAVDAKTGIATVSDEYPLFKCKSPEPGVVYSGANRCPDSKTTKLGVVWKQTRTISANGNSIKVVNTFTSTDKKAHTVRMIQKDRMKGGGYRYGTTGAFTDFNGDEKTNITGYGAKVDPASTTAFANSIGQVVFGSKATTWASSGYYGNDFYAMFSASVKAGGSADIKVGYTLITSDSKATTQIAAVLK